MTPARFEPAAPRSRVKHSITEPLRPLYLACNIFQVCLNYAHGCKIKPAGGHIYHIGLYRDSIKIFISGEP